MGLKRALNRNENRNLFPYPDAYFRVENMNSSGGSMSFSVYGYPDKAARDASLPDFPPPMPSVGNERDRIIFDRGFSVSISQLSVPTPTQDETLDDLIKKSLYVYIKTLPLFANCVDVLEEGQS